MMDADKVMGGVKSARAIIRRFSEDENGATAIEYGLIVSLIFVAILGAVRQYTENTSLMYSEISSSLD